MWLQWSLHWQSKRVHLPTNCQPVLEVVHVSVCSHGRDPPGPCVTHPTVRWDKDRTYHRMVEDWPHLHHQWSGREHCEYNHFRHMSITNHLTYVLQVSGVLSPYEVNGGSNPAIFGMLGVLYVELFQFWQIVDRAWLELIKLTSFVVVLLFLGTFPFLNNWAHLG